MFLLYAHDLRDLLEIGGSHQLLLEDGYREIVAALTSALESKGTGIRAHSERVQRYAVELARSLDRELADDRGVQSGFLLHDVGKIGIADEILRKPGALTEDERRSMQSHTLLGEELLSGVTFLQGEGIRVIRSHHERWDGAGYPDRLAAREIPVGARVFAVADALDAMTTDRPYRRAGSWEAAAGEIAEQAGRQFDPEVVDAFFGRESRLRAIHREVTAELRRFRA